MIGNIKKDVCVEINNKLGVTNPSGNPPVVAGTCYTTHSAFNGTYSGANVTWCGVSNQPSACVYDGAYGSHYYLYKILWER